MCIVNSWRKCTRKSDELLTLDGKHSSKGIAVAGQHNIYGEMGTHMDWDKTNTACWVAYDVAYPYLKEVCEFWDEQLTTVTKGTKEQLGKLVVPKGWSPEHEPHEDGCSYNEIVWDLYTNFVKAADVLGVDKEYRDIVASKRDKLLWPGIGSFGQLMEWMEEQKDEKTDHHRHTSYLFGVFPGHQFNWETSPALVNASLVSLNARGIDPKSDVREWSFAWRTAIYARLRDAENAHHLLHELLSDRNTCPNMFGLHAPMQIDGNFGITGAIAEMLVQSHEQVIELLPALPRDWAAGHAKGLRARGEHQLDIYWANHTLNNVLIKSAFAGDVFVTCVRASDKVFWYESPAADGMNEALPIGNGRIGGLVYGHPEKEIINMNEITLWTGDDNPTQVYHGPGFGDYQTLGNIYVDLPEHKVNTQYKRALDIGDAVTTVRYESHGVQYKREYFVSHVSDVLVGRLTADKGKAYTGRIELQDSHKVTANAVNNTIAVDGKLVNGLRFAWKVLAQHTGGTLKVNGTVIEFNGCDALTLIVSAGTDYVFDDQKKFKSGEDPAVHVNDWVAKASVKSYETLRTEHLSDFHSLFNRVDVDLGQSSAQQTALSTAKRKVEAVATFDPDFEEMFFQFGRYLMISSSRTSLPANLQGLWNDNNSPAWHADYHTNINIEMNYWPAETTNLAECHLPLFNMIRSQLNVWRKQTRTSDELLTPLGKHSSKAFKVEYAQHFWEHYAFGMNKTFLKDVAYPYLKEVSEFWDEQLNVVTNGTKQQLGKLVVPKGWSPEHGPHEDGFSYNQEIVWDLYTNYVKAADVLGVDKEFRDRVAAHSVNLKSNYNKIFSKELDSDCGPNESVYSESLISKSEFNIAGDCTRNQHIIQRMISPIDVQLVSTSGPQTFRVSGRPLPGQSRQQFDDFFMTLDQHFGDGCGYTEIAVDLHRRVLRSAISSRSKWWAFSASLSRAYMAVRHANDHSFTSLFGEALAKVGVVSQLNWCPGNTPNKWE
ncbi:unnamed protein product, partial [Oppiella nova]